MPENTIPAMLKAIDLVKIDVEGAEYRVLKGMEKSLAAGHIKDGDNLHHFVSSRLSCITASIRLEPL